MSRESFFRISLNEIFFIRHENLNLGHWQSVTEVFGSKFNRSLLHFRIIRWNYIFACVFCVYSAIFSSTKANFRIFLPKNVKNQFCREEIRYFKCQLTKEVLKFQIFRSLDRFFQTRTDQTKNLISTSRRKIKNSKKSSPYNQA